MGMSVGRVTELQGGALRNLSLFPMWNCRRDHGLLHSHLARGWSIAVLIPRGIFPGFWESEVSLLKNIKDLCLQEEAS